MKMKQLSERIYCTESRFYCTFYSVVAVFCVLLALTACSTDVHGVRIDVVRKVPDISVPIATSVPALGPNGS
jgi:hypothetical protein